MRARHAARRSDAPAPARRVIGRRTALRRIERRTECMMHVSLDGHPADDRGAPLARSWKDPIAVARAERCADDDGLLTEAARVEGDLLGPLQLHHARRDEPEP